MPSKDSHGKTAQDYRAALIADLDAVPDYRRRRKAQRSPLLFVWLLVPVALLWLNRQWVQRWLHPAFVRGLPPEFIEVQTPAPSPPLSAPVHHETIAASQPLDVCLKQINFVNKEAALLLWRRVAYARSGFGRSGIGGLFYSTRSETGSSSLTHLFPPL
ncbi:hypothetical protein [Pseudomonas oryzihabitans]|uniref:hypothetical protein n=1 Tax=Pseudomonas oryzihabitans TaxID=47885 RepID=UPI00241CBDE1|nr:hypothetical protein [Pseudomonas oryzihabitans]